MEEFINDINGGIGYNIVGLYNDSITLNCTTLSKIFEKYSFDFIKHQFQDNLFLQLSLTKLIQDGVHKSIPGLTDYFTSVGLSRTRFRNIFDSTNLRKRTARLDLAEMITELVRTQLESIFSPIRSTINDVLDQVYDAVMNLYINETSDGFLQFISSFTNALVPQLAQAVTLAKTYVNAVIDDFIYGNGTVTESTSA